MTTRLDRVRENLRAGGFCGTVISDITSIDYLVARRAAHIGERLFALYIPVDGGATLFVNELFPVAPGDELDVCYHNDNDVATRDLAAALPTGIVGIDRFLPAQFLLEILEQRPDITAKLGSFAVDNARMIKDQQEQEAMRVASRINDQVFALIPSLLKEGMSEIELGKLLGEKYAELGDPGAGPAIPLVCFGEGSAEPHHSNTNARLKAGDVVLIDGGQCSYGYCSDMTRTFFYRSMTPEQERVYNIVNEANRLATQAVRAGVPLMDIDRAAREYIASFGYGQYFTHRTGHNIGRSGHEEPSVSAVNAHPAQSGMCFSIEPGIYLPGKFGVRIEDLIIVTDDGCEVLNGYTKDIQIIE